MRVAVAGLGWWGRQIVACLHASPRFEVLWGVDPAPSDDVEAFAAVHGFRLATDLGAVLADPALDGVLLATPHALHEEQALAVLAAGKELFCEKPLAMTAAGAERIVAAAEAAGKVLGIGHERRFEPAFEELQALVAAGALGRLLLFEANVSHDLFRRLAPSNWRLDGIHAPAGMMTAVGIHLTDLFVHLAGPAAEVRATTASLVFRPPAEDLVAATIVFRSGARASLTSLSATPFHGRVTVYGDAGWVEIVSEANVDQGKPTVLTHVGDGRRRRVVHPATDTVTRNLEAWADAAAGGAPYRFSGQELVENIRILEAIVISTRANGAPWTL